MGRDWLGADSAAATASVTVPVEPAASLVSPPASASFEDATSLVVSAFVAS